MSGSKKSLTLEEWAEVCENPNYGLIYGIHCAMAQARKEAIEECLRILDNLANGSTWSMKQKIRALLEPDTDKGEKK